MRIVVRRGLTVPLAGAPAPRVDRECHVARAGLLGDDLGHRRVEPLVEPEQPVQAGTPVLRDRAEPGLLFCAPVSGRVERIETGRRRRLAALVIAADGEDQRRDFDVSGAGEAQGLRALLLEAGQWPALRARPFERIASPRATPGALFVTALDTAPHAPDPRPVIEERAADFDRGLAALRLLTAGPVFLCQDPGPPLADGDDQLRVVHVVGRHPAGLVGTHIARLWPPRGGEVVWHIDYQDLIAIGHLLGHGRIDPFRIVSLSGPGCQDPRLVRVPLGADLHALAGAAAPHDHTQVLSGPVVAGRESAFLGRYHRQVTVLKRPPPRRSHWLLDALRQARRPAPFIPTQSLEQTLGSAAPVVPLLRALSIADVEAAKRLGCLHLAEEDLALATYVTGGRTDFGRRLRAVLDHLEREA
ncbi:Na(+)-translocating NADH-quinone reductase subunit A [Alcanivorax sp. 521-1]|uniref:Na(+)-translocating NADH-quinone reductase subunit A n=1 Tax=Alloalcanivorax profundimaris TaxID=2735259 RepID=A0ABS0AL49_9GAMM|nr:hypothetical protein [Alloalcanivorax profundimaris]MBF5054765.1 Na(+)-translocating NADH-quinone reductase subunit A [Alloalcanivorax profundimaris]MBU58531.1 hypothetical protein [Alcanivorax sp.]